MIEKYTNDRNFNLLIEKYNIINAKGYIKGINNNNNASGLTFEKELGKKANSLYQPDFKDIEIKCKQEGSKYSIKLFSLSFHGPYMYENISMLKKYGKVDEKLLNKNKLYTKLIFGKKILYNNYYFEFDEDNVNKMLCVNIYDKSKCFVEKRGYIPLTLLKRRVNLKLNKLAIIKVSKKKRDDILYFKYYQISCYLFKGYDNFLEMIRNGTIKCCVLLRYSKNRKAIAKNKSCGLMFFINEYDINKIYKKIYSNKKI